MITSPTLAIPSAPISKVPSFVIEINGNWGITVIVQSVQVGSTGVQEGHGVGSDESSVTVTPVGSIPDAVAKLSTWPASISAWVNVYVAVYVDVAPTASEVALEPAEGFELT